MIRRLLVGVLLAALALTTPAAAPSVPRAAAGGPPAPSRPPDADPIGRELADALAVAAPNDELRVIVHFRDLDRVPRGPGSRQTVVALRAAADASQRGLQPQLDQWRAAGGVRRYTRLWIRNAVSMTARPAVLQAIARAPGVVSIEPDRTFAIQAPPALATRAAAAPAAAGTAEPNVDLIHAPAVWALGARGAGVVVASVDTGVDVSHPDLAGSFRGGTNSWYDPNGEHPSSPFDANGHGTWTTGLMVAGDNGGSAIGVAPAARWIAVKLFADDDRATTTNVHLAFQWLLDPDGDPLTDDAPDIVNNSWSAGPVCDLEFEPDIAALVAAGIVPVFAAGNGGPTIGSIESPATDPSAFSAGASTDDAVASFSGRGPTSCGRMASVVAPDVVAPGVDVWTTDRFGFYARASGTSMAAPHVSGALALLRGAFPARPLADLEAAVRSTAVDLAPAGPDDAAGNGRIDVLAAYRQLAGDVAPTPTPPPIDAIGPVAGDLVLRPGFAARGPVTVEAVVDDTATGGSSIVAAEAFVDVAPAPGDGVLLAGTFGGTTATVSGEISAQLLAGLADGPHTVGVRGRDAVAGWGPPIEATVVLDRAAPIVAAPTVSLEAGVTLSSGQVPTLIRWTGSDLASGIARYEVRQQRDGGPWVTVADEAGRVLRTSLTPAHSYRFAVRAIDLAGNASGWAMSAPTRLAGWSEASSAIRYAGPWSTAASPAFWGGRVRASSTAGARATFTTTSTGAAWVAVTGPTRGRATIRVDGRLVATVDLYSPTWTAGRIAWAANWATARARRVEIQVLATSGRPRVDIDGFITR